MKKLGHLTLYLVLLLIFNGCGPDPMPKPRGYFRIDLPGRDYKIFDTTFPYTFDYPDYATIVKDESTLSEPYWINLSYDSFHAQLHLSYKRIDHNLAKYLEDSRTLVNKHIPKANSIKQQEFENKEAHVYGLVYEIRGVDAASPYQFYLTDSTHHFVRGALYFDLVPNNDSLAPVIDFLKVDIQRMITSFRWKSK